MMGDAAMGEPNKNQLSEPFSLYLDVIRFIAALAVVLYHLHAAPFTNGAVHWRISSHGAIAVTVFFVLSGFVIAYVASTKETTFKHYFASRFSRIYSVAIPALVLTLVFDTVGSAVNADFYSIHRVLGKPESWAGYLSSLFFVNEFQVFGFNGIVPGTNDPYWSLSFEVTYYAIAGALLFFRPRFSVAFTLLIVLLAGRTIAALLPIWALGFALFHVRPARSRVPAVVWFFLALASALLLVVLPWLGRITSFDNFGLFFPWGGEPANRNLLVDYVAAAAFAVHMVAARALLSHRWTIGARSNAMIRWLGSLTFPVYLLHQPTICLFSAISPWKNTSLAHVAFVCAGVVLVAVGVVPVCERVRSTMRTFLLHGHRVAEAHTTAV